MDIQEIIRRLIAQRQQKQPQQQSMGLMGMQQQPDIMQMLFAGAPQQALNMLGADMQIGKVKSWSGR
jgi:hypothetical protein